MLHTLETELFSRKVIIYWEIERELVGSAEVLPYSVVRGVSILPRGVEVWDFVRRKASFQWFCNAVRKELYSHLSKLKTDSEEIIAEEIYRKRELSFFGR